MRETKRDRAWSEALETILLGSGEITKQELSTYADVSTRTAGDVLRVMSADGFLRKVEQAGPKPDKWTAGERLPATLSRR